MNRLLSNSLWGTVLILLSMSMVSCQPDVVEIPASELYTRDFIKHFGVTGIAQDWNSAVRVTAEVDPSVLSGAEEIKVCTAWPGNPDCFVVATYPASERKFSFDFPADLDMAYVQVTDANGISLYSAYVPVRNGSANVGSRSRAISQTPVPYHFDLSGNKSLGTFPTDKNSAVERFWKNFGIAIDGGADIPDEPEKPLVPEPDYVQEITVSADNKIVGNTAPIYVEYSPIKNKLTKSVEYKLRFTGDNPSGVQGLKTGISKDKCTVYIGQSNLTKVGDYWEATFTRDEEWFPKDVANAKFLEVTGNWDMNAYLVSVIITEKFNAPKPEPKPEIPDTKGQARLSDLLRLYGFSHSPQTTMDGFKVDYLKPNPTYDETGYSVADLVPIIGEKTGVFREEINKETLECNLEKYREELAPDEGVKYVVANDGTEVSVDYLFGGASTLNSFGYFYCSAEEAALPEEERMKVLFKKPMFVLIYSANQWTNLMLQKTEGGEWTMEPDYSSFQIESSGFNEGKDSGDSWKHCTYFNDLVQKADKDEEFENGFIPRIRSTRYQLVYYSPDQIDADGRLKPGARGSYKFPKGTNIGFFVISGGQYAFDKDGNIGSGAVIDHRRIAFSRPVMNRYIGNTIKHGHSHRTTDGNNSAVNNGTGEDKDWTAFVRYRWNGQRLMGVEDYFAENDGQRDGGDHDMNDIIFRINGEFENIGKELNDEDDRKQSWIIACEDLGGTYDFDFNDVVFGVTHVTGTEVATVTALAAGGTMPVYLRSSYPQIDDNGQPISNPDGILRPAEAGADGEFHSWWGRDRYYGSQINVDSWTGRGASVTVRVPMNFTLTADETSLKPDNDQHMGGFQVIVGKPGSPNSTVITAPNKDNNFTAPQMFLVPSKWFWPIEEQEIDGVYSGFIDWKNNWWTKRDGNAGGNVIQHAWPTFMENN